MSDYTYMFVQMIVILGLVCLLAFGFLRYILPRFAFARNLQKKQVVTVVARCHLDYRHQVMVTRVGGRYFMLGLGDHSVTMLSELNRNDVEGA